MSKKQFVALADSIREHNRLAKFNGENPFTDDQLAALARFCASVNPRFKRERWLDYIAGRCGPSGGTVTAKRVEAHGETTDSRCNPGPRFDS
jgi:hypothetical protein